MINGASQKIKPNLLNCFPVLYDAIYINYKIFKEK